MSELPKTFEPGAIEQRWYAHWEQGGLFRPERGEAAPWTIVMPPPNVTGSLHIGHALDITLQDILTRHARMIGKDALWVVGTDHAGIATQMVVERNLASQGVSRAGIGREAFLEHVWEWKAQSGGAITRQLRRLGASCDWANERFTMDDGFRRAVTHAFVELHKRGLVYRDKRLVNWDPKFHTAISDLEVEMREVDGHLWHFRYPLANGSGYIAIATTRPETILGDGAVAVHPDDERYRHLVGQKCKLPIVDRLIPIIADEHVEMDFGSGAVKITAAHDFDDFAVYLRHPEANIPLINLMTADARMNENTPPEFQGLDRYAARALVVEKFEALGLLDKIEPHKHNVPHGDRSGVVIEPWLTDQWYVDAATLAKPVLEATRSKAIKIVPESWSKTWFNWLENIQPWCVSRQLWWGHRIPAWFDDDGNIFVAASEDEARQEAGDRRLRQDEDVLDTWFSSALWPFATLGWPEATEELARHYPNDVLISGFDILFFWDARMAMSGMELTRQAPWKTLYLHGLVRDAHGQKMSKSKGNTVDPLGLIDKYGADALRFTLAAMESQGRDIKLDEKRVEGYRNFATKLWNAARFLQMNGVGASQSIAAPQAELPVNRWIIGEVVATLARLDKAFAELRFDDMADAIYHFTWGTFCDWYVELVKGHLSPLPLAGGESREAAGEGLPEDTQALPPTPSRGREGEETRAVAAWVFDQILVMLHPFMPFVTEELWGAMGTRPYELILAKWPEPSAGIDLAAKTEIEFLIDCVSALRSQRLDTGFKPIDIIPISVTAGGPKQIETLNKYEALLRRMARVRPATIELNTGGATHSWSVELRDNYELVSMPDQTGFVTAQLLAPGLTFLAFTQGFIDLEAERLRLSKSITAAEKDRDGLAARLNNPAFTERAKPEAVEKARADYAERAAEAERLAAALARLG